MTHPTFLQQLETVHEILARLSESPFFLEACQLALDDGEMTLGDALTAVVKPGGSPRYKMAEGMYEEMIKELE